MGSFLLRNAVRGSESGHGDIRVEGSAIAWSGASSDPVDVIECGSLVVLPGFIDIHNHGAVGVDVNEADVEGLVKIAEFLATRGVTSWLPTLVPDSEEVYERVIRAIDELIVLQGGKPIAQAVGVHYEGVFANERMCGALRPQYFMAGQASGPSLPRLRRGVHMTTLAPEIDGGIDLIRGLISERWIVSIGHTRADVDTLNAACEAGARHMTHFFNAMTGIHHRDVGVAGWGLSESAVTFDIIADGIHVDERMVATACRAKGTDRVSLISDSVAPTGLGDGRYKLWGETIIVENGRTRNERGSIAGSVIAMDDAVRLMTKLGFSPGEIERMASANPAALLGLSDRGSLDAGRRADIVGLDEAGKVEFVMISGQLVEC